MCDNSNFDEKENAIKEAEKEISADTPQQKQTADEANEQKTTDTASEQAEKDECTPPPPPPHNHGFGACPPPPNKQKPYGVPRFAGVYPPPYNPYASPYSPWAQPPKKKKHTWLIVTLGVLGFLLVFLLVIGAILGSSDEGTLNGVPALSEPYVAVLYIDSEIAGDYKYTEMYGSYSSYNQVFLIDTINGLKEDSYNQGLMLYINSPGGEIIATDELSRAIESYKADTNRPVYAYFGATAASGAYWIGAVADKIIANKYCVTGSIGVSYGTHIDISELLGKLGIKATALTSGENKAMGSMYEALTDEQKEIYQKQLDEMHSMFVNHVALHREMNVETVEEIADGRTMLAKEALKIGLIDQISYYDEAIAIMKADCGYSENIIFYDCPNPQVQSTLSLASFLQSEENTALSEEEALSALIKEIEENRRFMVIYR